MKDSDSMYVAVTAGRQQAPVQVGTWYGCAYLCIGVEEPLVKVISHSSAIVDLTEHVPHSWP